MKLESITQVYIDEKKRLLTTAIVSEVESSCILARQMIDRLGRPGIESDMEMVGGDRIWTIIWTKPELTLEQATQLVAQAIGLSNEPESVSDPFPRGYL